MNFKERVGIRQSNPEADLDVGNTALIGGGIPIIWGDNLKVYVVSGLETGYDADGNVTVALGIGYNKVRVNVADTVILHPANTGSAHTEYTLINYDGAIALTQDFDSELDPKVKLGHVDVDASGKATAAYDDRDLNLYLGDGVAGWKTLSQL